jgi:hypothetical protein
MARKPEEAPSADELKALLASRTKLEILLNPEKAGTVALLAGMDAITAGATAQAREKAATEMLSVARRLLKREWVRIKEELN